MAMVDGDVMFESSRDAGKTMETRTSLTQLLDQMNQRINALQRDHHAIAARIDALIPDADDHAHYDDHQEMRTVRRDRRRFWANLPSQLVAGVMLAIGGGAIVLLAYALFISYKPFQ